MGTGLELREPESEPDPDPDPEPESESELEPESLLDPELELELELWRCFFFDLGACDLEPGGVGCLERFRGAVLEVFPARPLLERVDLPLRGL